MMLGVRHQARKLGMGPMDAQRCLSTDMSDLSGDSMPPELDLDLFFGPEDACMDEWEAR